MTTIDAVTMAINNIRLSNPKLTANLDAGFAKMLKQSLLPPAPPSDDDVSSHTIIPNHPFAAFVDENERAKTSSKNLSRSATIAHSLEKLNTLHKLFSTKQHNLVVDIVGADIQECGNGEKETLATFSPLVRWIFAATKSNPHFTTLTINLVGPMMPKNLDGSVYTIAVSSKQSATICLKTAFYHEHICMVGKAEFPELSIAFNAGLWGYDSWLPTLRALKDGKNWCEGRILNFVVTSYTLEEAKDDFEVMDDFKFEVWFNVQRNVFASRVLRETAMAVEGRCYYENYAWMGFKVGSAEEEEEEWEEFEGGNFGDRVVEDEGGGGGEVQVEWEDFEGAAAEPENEYALVDDGDE